MFCLVLHWPPYGSLDIFDDSKGNLIFVTNMEKTVGRVTFRLLSSAYLMALKVMIYMCILSVKQNEENQILSCYFVRKFYAAISVDEALQFLFLFSFLV